MVIAQHVTGLSDVELLTLTRPLWEAFSHATITAQREFVHTCPTLSIIRYSFIQMHELMQCAVNQIAHASNKRAAKGFEHQFPQLEVWCSYHGTAPRHVVVTYALSTGCGSIVDRCVLTTYKHLVYQSVQ